MVLVTPKTECFSACLPRPRVAGFFFSRSTVLPDIMTDNSDREKINVRHDPGHFYALPCENSIKRQHWQRGIGLSSCRSRGTLAGHLG